MFGTHRGHSQAIAKGIDIDHMMAEILAKETGVCKGKGGSMHIASPDINYFATSGILGASSVIANGAALTIKKGTRGTASPPYFTATAPPTRAPASRL